MARPLRIHIPGATYHVMSRGNAKQCIFEDEEDHLRFLRILAEALERFGVACISYCLLWNHYHLLVSPGLHPVSRLMHQLNSQYCQSFNRRHGRSGHVLGGRFKGPIIDSDSYMVEALRYVAQNPVASGHVQRPEDWRWSSYGAIAGLEPCPSFLSLDRVWRAFDAKDEAVGRERFLAVMEAEHSSEMRKQLESALFLGGGRLARRLDPLLEPHRKNPDFTYLQRFATRPPLDEILHVPDTRAARDEAAYVAFCVHAYALREIGEVVGRPPGTIWSWVQRVRLRKAAEALSGDPAPATVPRRRRGQISIFE